MNQTLLKQCVAELIGTFTLIFIGAGAIYNASASGGMGLLGVALTHGLAIAVMVSAMGAISGGHLNPAVTLGLYVRGKIDFFKSIAYWLSQLVGATVAGIMLVGWATPVNPARTFGPALASAHLNNHLVYWIGPLLGVALAGLIYGRFLIKETDCRS